MDVQFHNHGTIWLAIPLTNAALDWIDEHIPTDANWFGRGLVVEHRYVGDIAQGMAAAGLKIAQV